MDNIGKVDLHNHNTNEIKELLNKARSNEYDVCVWGAGIVGKEFGRQILADYGISIDYYCDNNDRLHNLELIDGIWCRNSQRLIANAAKTVCFLLVRCSYIQMIYKQLVDMGVRYIVTYDDLLSLPETIRPYFPFMQKKQIAIYTCITGGYDNPIEPKNISECADYFLLSDVEPVTESIYKWIDIRDKVPKDIEDNISMNRYCKINAHEFFKDYRYSIYFDGNIGLKGDITECIPRLKKTRIGVLGRTYIESVYAEALRCMKIGRDTPEKIINQVEKYWNQGMPDDFGIFLCGVLVREHNNPICKKIMEEWWEEFKNNSKRDQISFAYVLWKNGFSREDLMLVCENKYMDPWKESPYWDYVHEHKKKRRDIRKSE